MKYLPLIFISYFAILNTSCNNTNNKSAIEYSDTIAVFKNYTFEGTEISIKQETLYFTKNYTRDSLYTYKYYSDKNYNGCTIYCFDMKNSRNLAYEIDYNNVKSELIFCQKKAFSVNGINHVVFKFLKDSQLIDGETSYFFMVDYGLLIKRSTTWRNFSKLTNLGATDNTNLLNSIYDIIISDSDFYRGYSNIIVNEKEVNKVLELTE